MNFNFWGERVVFVCQYYFWCMSILNMLEQYSVYEGNKGKVLGSGAKCERVFCLWERVVFGSVSSIIRLHSVSFADTVTLLRFPYWHQNVGEKRRERDTFTVNMDVGQDFNSLWWLFFLSHECYLYWMYPTGKLLFSLLFLLIYVFTLVNLHWKRRT